jgi:hypothetical protein
MTKKLLALGAGLALVFSVSGIAMAGGFAAPASSTYVQLGGGQGITYNGTYQNGGYATLTNNGGSHDLAVGDDVFKTTNLAAGTSLFTGVALITDLIVTADNNPGAFTASFVGVNSVAGNLTNSQQTIYSGTICPTGCLGGIASVSGQTVVKIAGAPFPISNTVIGVGGTATLMIGPAVIAVTGGPWVTGKVRITNVTSNVISMPTRSPAVTGIGITLEPTSMEVVRTFTTLGGFRTSNPTGQLETRATVTISGTNNLASASAAGQVTLVSPLRIDTGPLNVGNIPGKVKTTFVFAPEPGTLLLLASGAAGLVLIGRRRIRR